MALSTRADDDQIVNHGNVSSLRYEGVFALNPHFDKISRSRGMLDVGTPLYNADCTRNVALNGVPERNNLCWKTFAGTL